MEIHHKTRLFQDVMTASDARRHFSVRAMMSVAVGITGVFIVMAQGSAARAADGSAASGHPDLCRLLTKADVSRALKVTIVRAEALDTEEVGCEFSAQGSPADATAGHTVQLAKSTAAAHGATLDGPTEKLIETFSKGIFQGSDADKSASAAARHPGEVRVLTIAIQPGDANDQMPITRRTMAGLSPKGVTTVVGLGDEAFDSGGAMITARKGKTMIQFTYPSCACTTKDIVPLARKVVDAL
jgi:hypothetical protein